MIDTNHKDAVVEMVVCKNGHCIIVRVDNKTSELLVSSVPVDELKPMVARVKTHTLDTGKEFAGSAYIKEQLKSTINFVTPFAIWERSGNENFNGLLRQYIPNKKTMSTVTDEEIKMIKTSSELLQQSLKRVPLPT